MIQLKFLVSCILIISGVFENANAFIVKKKVMQKYSDTLILKFKIKEIYGIGWGMVYKIEILDNENVEISNIGEKILLYAAIGNNVESKIDLQKLQTGKFYLAGFIKKKTGTDDHKMPIGATGIIDDMGNIYLLNFLKTDTMNGEIIEIKGTAYNTKSGAMLLTDNKTCYYIEGLEEWPSDITEKKVIVRGIIKSEFFDEEKLKTKKGEYIQGMSGEKLSLQNAKWKLQD